MLYVCFVGEEAIVLGNPIFAADEEARVPTSRKRYQETWRPEQNGIPDDLDAILEDWDSEEELDVRPDQKPANVTILGCSSRPSQNRVREPEQRRAFVDNAPVADVPSALRRHIRT